jgi:hypothetical protein
MRAMMIVEVLEGIDMLGDFVDPVRRIDGCVEFVTPCAVASLDGSSELGRAWRQHIERDGAVQAGVFRLS